MPDAAARSERRMIDALDLVRELEAADEADIVDDDQCLYETVGLVKVVSLPAIISADKAINIECRGVRLVTV
jgi:hypothetical protein